MNRGVEGCRNKISSKAGMDGEKGEEEIERRRKRRRKGHLPLAAGSESTPEMRSEQPAGYKQ